MLALVPLQITLQWMNSTDKYSKRFSPPAYAFGNDLTDRFVGVVIMPDAFITQTLCSRDRSIERIFIQNRNPNNGGAYICIRESIEYILKYRTGTLVSSEGACGGQKG